MVYYFELELGCEELIHTAGAAHHRDLNPAPHDCESSAPSLSYPIILVSRTTVCGHIIL